MFSSVTRPQTVTFDKARTVSAEASTEWVLMESVTTLYWGTDNFIEGSPYVTNIHRLLPSPPDTAPDRFLAFRSKSLIDK